MDETVEMHPAYMWDCQGCGEENFVRAISAPLNKDDDMEMAQAREALGLEAFEDVPDGSFTTYPDEVECAKCGGIYKTYR